MMAKSGTLEHLWEEGGQDPGTEEHLANMPEGMTCAICDGPDGPDGKQNQRLYDSFEGLYHFSNFFGKHHGWLTSHFHQAVHILPWVDDLVD